MLEICVEDLAGVDAAVAGGADRLEVCSALALGGLTPSPSMVAYAARSGVPVRALIRPRPGAFHYGDAELALMAMDIATLLEAGARGVVLGAADDDNELDEAATRRLVEAARGRGGPRVGLTLHRMIDLVSDPASTVVRAASLGFDCVLSSGGKPAALDGAGTLASMIAAAPPDVTVMAGGGITPQTVPELLARSGVKALHSSARGEPQPAPKSLIALGFASGTTAKTSADVVKALGTAFRAGVSTEPFGASCHD